MNNPKLPAEKLQYARSISEILSDLSRPIPDRFLETRKQGNQTITYVPWHVVCRILDYYAPGWTGMIVEVKQIENFVVVTYQISLQAREGIFSRQASGQESLDKAFGDPVCNAEAQAFKRAAAKFGLGLDLYEG